MTVEAPRPRGPEPPGRELLERVRARDPQALAEFFERYVDLVYGLVYRLLGRKEAAEDVTSDVFLKVHRAAPQLDPARDPAPWLIAIATNACRDVWRSGAYRMNVRSASIEEDAGIASRLASPGDAPGDALLRAERERAVRQALGELPEALRAAIVLHDYQGLDHEEVARVTGIEHAAARKRYSRAIAALGKKLKGRLA